MHKQDQTSTTGFELDLCILNTVQDDADLLSVMRHNYNCAVGVAVCGHSSKHLKAHP